MIRAVILLVGLVCPLWSGVAAAEEIIFLAQPGLPVDLDPHFQTSLRPEPYKTPPRDLVALRTAAKNISQQAIVHVLIELVTVDGGQVRRGMTALNLDPLAPGHAGEIDLWVASGDRWLLDRHELTVAWVRAVGFMGGATWYADDEAAIVQLAKLEVGLAEGRPVETLATDSGLSLGDPREDATLEEIARHVVRMYGVADPRRRREILKWTGPVTYSYGDFIREADRARFEAAMRYLTQLTGLSIRKTEAPDADIDIVLLFTSDIMASFQAAPLRKLFKRSSESEEAFDTRIASVSAGGEAIQFIGINHDMVDKYVGVVNGADVRGADIPGLMMRQIFRAFAFTNPSDAIRPSVANTEFLSLPDRLPSIDEAFLRMLYSTKIKNGAPLTEALPLIIAGIYHDLYGS